MLKCTLMWVGGGRGEDRLGGEGRREEKRDRDRDREVRDTRTS